jgi:hypothetical protein
MTFEACAYTKIELQSFTYISCLSMYFERKSRHMIMSFVTSNYRIGKVFLLGWIVPVEITGFVSEKRCH